MTRKRWRSYLRAALAAGEMTLRQNVLDGFILFTILVQPLVIALLALWILRQRPGDYGIFVVVGSGLTGLWSSLLFISGNSVTWERWGGTLEVLAGVPTPLAVIVFGKTMASVLQSIASMIAAYLLASLLFGYPLHVLHPWLFMISVVFTILSFVCFGLIIAPIFVLNPGVQGWQNAMEFPVYILAGFLFPIALLPGWTTPLSYLLAPYWAARALHGASSGQAATGAILLDWGMMLLFSLAYLILANWLFVRVTHKTRVDGTLALQ